MKKIITSRLMKILALTAMLCLTLSLSIACGTGGGESTSTPEESISIPDSSPNTVLGVQLDNMEDWFYCVSMRSWNHPGENFLSQWKILNCCIASMRG